MSTFSAVVVMGVSGCGKSTVGQALAEKLCCEFVDGDDCHPTSNKEKMRQGIPLEDTDRWPWLEELHKKLAQWVRENSRGVLACSALRRTYRDVLVGRAKETMLPGDHTDIFAKTLFVLLHGTEDLLSRRLKGRYHAFMSPDLLQSQLSTLEVPADDEHSIQCDTANSIDEIVQSVIPRIVQHVG